ncbi:hypothetical protein BWQ96_00972 [Gracilariopsis chorda]|uniref:Uncharacterized protein n=1 Tax=Gracilariopsis chorda TaxID=448386 RepID=A0A2V3J4E6_9FLOR|nr:hypothetical protein BWQ96_00972 [Gracilariopsis chorda]|eukprot:PXF49183.1 hypothetical protein BWQ96_00972 [Gracilariopsis chorda]
MRLLKREGSSASRWENHPEVPATNVVEHEVTVLPESQRRPDRPRLLSRTGTSSPVSPARSSDVLSTSTGGVSDLFHEELEIFEDSREPDTLASSSLGSRSSFRRSGRGFEPKSQPSSPAQHDNEFPRRHSEHRTSSSSIAALTSLMELARTPSALVDRARAQRRQTTKESVRERAKDFAKQLERSESAASAYSVISSLSDFAFAVVELTALLERQEALDDFGAFRKMVELQNTFIQHAGIQRIVCSVLGSLRIDESTGGLKIAMMLTVDTIVQSLRLHERDSGICKAGIRALTSLSNMNDVRSRIIPSCNAIGVAVECMELHAGDEGVQSDGTRFLSHASLHSETNKSQIAMHGGLRRAVRAALEFPASRVLHTHVSTILRNITVGRPDVVAQAEILNSVEALLDTLKLHGQASMTAVHALAALHHLTTSMETIKRIVRYQSWESVLMGTAKRHSGKATVQTLAMAVAGSVAAADGPTAQVKLAHAGAIKIALTAMHRFVNRSAVLFTGARLVKVLLVGFHNAMDEVKQCGGTERLLDILYCTVVTPTFVEERYSGYSDVFDNP